MGSLDSIWPVNFVGSAANLDDAIVSPAREVQLVDDAGWYLIPGCGLAYLPI